MNKAFRHGGHPNKIPLWGTGRLGGGETLGEGSSEAVKKNTQSGFQVDVSARESRGRGSGSILFAFKGPGFLHDSLVGMVVYVLINIKALKRIKRLGIV